MKKAFISFAVLVLLTSISFSKTLKDIPDSHWAAPSVYELIKAGIVDGYPDGTFRGKGKISRYESAVLAATLFSKVEISEARDEKLIAELRAEVQDLKYHFSGIIKEGEKKDIVFSGDLNSRFRMANVAFSKNKGFEFDYRLRSTMYRDFGHGIY
ncbi:MAG: S-layer homology domain-containing protein, partial [Candidatus Saganbacteria bacterium]|nr:S-layer homology domain-containing protein [Candidatus Saganbacteria bacterium]